MQTKLSKEQQNLILALKREGFGSRYIANQVGCSKSTVNDWYKTYKTQKIEPEQVSKKPRILVLDIETSPSIAATFSRWKVNLGQDNIIHEGGWILTAAYKYLGDPEVKTLKADVNKSEGMDLELCKELWKVIRDSSAVVAHNAVGFDMKVLETRCLMNNLPALPSVKVIDTSVMVKKKLKFNSNKLDSIGEVLGLGRKMQHQGIKLWIDVMQGCPEAMQTMLEYNIRDVELLEDVYLRLRQVGHKGTNFNAGLYFDDGKMHCPICGSTEIHPTGKQVYTALSAFDEYYCSDCHSVHRNRHSSTTKEDRQKLLLPVL